MFKTAEFNEQEKLATFPEFPKSPTYNSVIAIDLPETKIKSKRHRLARSFILNNSPAKKSKKQKNLSNLEQQILSKQ